MKKSIKQLRRYRKFLMQRSRDVSQEMKDMATLSSVGINLDFDPLMEYVNSVSDVLSILQNEVTIATLENSIQYDGKEISIQQGLCILQSLKEKLTNVDSLRHVYLDALRRDRKPPISAMEAKAKMVSFFNASKELREKIYDLDDKIERAEESAMIDVDMAGLIVVLE